MTLRSTFVSTDSLPQSQRCAYWEAYSSDWLVDLKCTPYSEQGLMARQNNVWIPDLGLSLIAGNQHIIERTQTHIQRTPKEGVFVSFDFISAAFFYQGKTCHSVQPNDLVVYRTDKPYLFGFKHQMSQIIIDLPESDWCYGELGHLDEPIKVRANHATHRWLLRTLAQQCRQFIGQPREDQLQSLREHVQGLLQAIFSFQQDHKSERALSTIYMVTARQFIAEHMATLALSNTQIAAATGVSERHLQRLFVQHLQCSVQDYVMEQRLQRAFWLLNHFKERVGGVERVAFESGFTSLAHFSRRFKRRFGQPPSTLIETTSTKRQR